MNSETILDFLHTRKFIYKRLFLFSWMIFSFFLVISCTKNMPSDEVPTVRDWMNSFLKVKGYGSLNFQWEIGERRFEGLQEARKDAYDKIRRGIYSLPVGAQKTVQDLVNSKKEIGMKVRRFIRTAKITQTRVVMGAGIEIDMELYLGASLKSILELIEKAPNLNTNQDDLHDKPGL